jgi:sugar lactone lactonase YvrE
VCDEHPPSLHNEHVCGRPLGLRFDKHDNLYIADAYFGLLVMGPEGGVAKVVSTLAEGIPFKFVNDLDLDENGTIYFTDSSARRPRRWPQMPLLKNKTMGHEMRLNP